MPTHNAVELAEPSDKIEDIVSLFKGKNTRCEDSSPYQQGSVPNRKIVLVNFVSM